jgi:hypothetical protein
MDSVELQKYMPQDPSQPENFQPKTETEKRAGSLIVRSELNLEQNSIFTVSTYRRKSREIVVREIAPTGEIIERRAIIGKTAGGIETGVLTTHHFKVYLALLEFWEQAGRPLTEPVHFTVLKIIKRLGLVKSGKNYQVIKRLLRDLRQIPLTFQNSFYIPKKEKHTDLSDITILNHLRIYERKSRGTYQKTYGYGEFQFDRYILENLINNYSHPLRLDIVKGFKRHRDTAILLYTYLDRCLAFKDKYEVALEKLFEHLDLSQRHVKYPSGRKRVIEPVLKELEGKPLSTGILSYCRIHRTQDGKDYKLVAHKKQFEGLPSGEGILELPREAPPRQHKPDELMARLTQEGLTDSQAEELLTRFGVEVISLQLQALPYRLEHYRERNEQVNAAAILYRSIKENWTLPRSYFEAEEREERERTARHYILWHCKNTFAECQNSRRLIMTPKEHGAPRSCPLCRGAIEIVEPDHKVYPDRRT